MKNQKNLQTFSGAFKNYLEEQRFLFLMDEKYEQYRLLNEGAVQELEFAENPTVSVTFLTNKEKIVLFRRKTFYGKLYSENWWLKKIPLENDVILSRDKKTHILVSSTKHFEEGTKLFRVFEAFDWEKYR